MQGWQKTNYPALDEANQNADQSIIMKCSRAMQSDYNFGFNFYHLSNNFKVS
jgi:hypothetical protein